MDTKKGTILTPLLTGPHWCGVPLYAFLFLIARYANSELQSLRTCFQFRQLPFNHIRFSLKSHFRNPHLCMISGKRAYRPSKDTFKGTSHGIEKESSYFKRRRLREARPRIG
jgi:hypothetical protein